MTQLKKTTFTTLMIIASLLCLSFVSVVSAEQTESAKAKIARAMSAAPDFISKKASIVDMDGTELRKGSNGWVCLPGIALMPGDDHPMCNDAVWMGWMKAAAAGTPYSTDIIGFSYMLAGDAMVNNADPTATDPKDGGVWVQEGPHLMLLMPTKAMMADLTRDPFAGGPYVMWDNTPLVHVMVPLGTK